MIHYALPTAPPSCTEEDFFRYGDLAIPALVENLLKLTGKTAASFTAKIVGGAQTFANNPSRYDIGHENYHIAKQILSQLQINVIGEKFGGAFGTKVLFHVQSGKLQVASLETSTSEGRRRKTAV
jgi:chemotaxis receptor (MCP) glutamine deamidase CheD